MRRPGRAALLVTAGLLLGVSVYAGLIGVGLVRSPFAPVAAGDLELARSGRDGVRVLFVGNSLTFKNDLPELVHRLGGRRKPIFAGSFTAPGWELRQFAGDYQLDRLLKEVHWDVVVLQEQSQVPSFAAADRGREFTPYVKELAAKIRKSGAQPLLFVTWAHRLGDRQNVPGDTYAAMQQRVVDGYRDAARASASPVAPVGVAWAEALIRRPQLSLWARIPAAPAPTWPPACSRRCSRAGRRWGTVSRTGSTRRSRASCSASPGTRHGSATEQPGRRAVSRRSRPRPERDRRAPA
jgi:hypothetical protein